MNRRHVAQRLRWYNDARGKVVERTQALGDKLSRISDAVADTCLQILKNERNGKPFWYERLRSRDDSSSSDDAPEKPSSACSAACDKPCVQKACSSEYVENDYSDYEQEESEERVSWSDANAWCSFDVPVEIQGVCTV